MNALKSFVCVVLFLGALGGALWPFLHEGEANWLFDMDIYGGVQIVYRADWSDLPADKQTPEAQRKLMQSSHLRLDARLARFQGADVRVQMLGEDRLLVEVPGVRDIAKVKADLGQPKVVAFAPVQSVSTSKDARHRYPWQTRGSGGLWLSTAPLVPFGGDILYERMTITGAGFERGSWKERKQRYELSLPLNAEGQEKMARLTSQVYDHPVELIDGGKTVKLRLLALFLDRELKDVFEVQSAGIRNGVISIPDLESARLLKRLLASGPMPVPFPLESERSISPLLGRTLRNQGVIALVVSVVLLIVLMGVSYLERPWFSFVYVVTLAFWFLCLVTLANFQLFRISLLQLAGYVLLLGMNTDAMVLVFEDLRQEFKGERRFRMALVGEAFGTEWMVVFWGMVTTVAILVPLYLQGGVFEDYVRLMVMGMGVNVLGFVFARLLMSLPVTEELARIRINRTGLAEWLARIDLGRLPYARVAPVLVVLAVVALVAYPRLTLSPTFAGGKAMEVAFSTPVPAADVQDELARTVPRAKVMTQQREGQTSWAFVTFPADVDIDELAVLRQLKQTTGVEPTILSVSALSRTLVAKTRLRVSAQMFLGLLALAIISVVIYNLNAGGLILVALAHDVAICLGAMAVLGIPLDLPAIAALATMAGYSINDSIVILHKLKLVKIKTEQRLGRELDPTQPDDLALIRRLPAENLRGIPARVLITSVSTALPMLVLAALAGGVFRDYALIVLCGVVFGTLSSIYLVGRVIPTGFLKWR